GDVGRGEWRGRGGEGAAVGAWGGVGGGEGGESIRSKLGNVSATRPSVCGRPVPLLTRVDVPSHTIPPMTNIAVSTIRILLVAIRVASVQIQLIDRAMRLHRSTTMRASATSPSSVV